MLPVPSRSFIEASHSRRAEQHFSPFPVLESVCDAGTEARTRKNKRKG
jgi:hypothetical protein